MLTTVKETSENKFQIMISDIKSSTKTLLLTDHGRKVIDKLSMDYSSYFQNGKKTKSKSMSSSKSGNCDNSK